MKINLITIINEKSSQAKHFAQALGNSSSAFKGTIPVGQFKGQPYQIVWAAGHLYELKDLKDMVPEDEVDNFTSWDYNMLPFDRHKINWQKQLKVNGAGHGARYYMNTIKKSLADSDIAIIATDYDPSGEGNLLGWEIIDGAHFRGKVYRCHHLTEEKDDILKAFDKLEQVSNNSDSPLRDGLYFKGRARERFDFLTIQYVRVVTDLAAKKQVLLPGGVVREGRLKSSIVELIGSSQFKHDHFKPHSSYVGALKDSDGNVFVNSELKDAPSLDEVNLSQLPKGSVSVEISNKKSIKKVPKLYDLAQVIAKLNKKGIASFKKLNKLAEDLYQAHYLSYPRTEDNLIAPAQLEQLKPLVPKIASIVGVDLNLLDINDFKPYLIGPGSHGANRPGLRLPKSLDDLDAEFGKGAGGLYEELARSFLAGFAKEKVISTHKYADSETKKFIYTASEVLEHGFEEVLNTATSDAKLPAVGSSLTPIIHEKKATRPALATTDAVVSYLARNNIGTGATRSKTLEDISETDNKHKLVNNLKGKFKLTELGQLSFLAMQGTYLANPQMTKDLDGYLEKIKKGKITEKQFLDFFDTLFSNDKQKILKNGKLFDNLPKHKVVHHNKVSGVFKGENVKISDTWGKHKFTDDELAKLFNGENITFRYTNDAKVTGHLAKEGKYPLGFVKTEMRYPKPEMLKGVYVPTGKKIEFPPSFSEHSFNADEVKELLLGHDISFVAQGKKGKYTAVIKLVFGPSYNNAEDKWHLEFANKKKRKAKK